MKEQPTMKTVIVAGDFTIIGLSRQVQTWSR